MEIKDQKDYSMLAVNVGLFSNIFLAAIKTVIGVIGHSPALLADGINSTSDVAYYIVVRIFMVMARKPADDEHPYGHRQLESIAALAVGAFVVTTAIAIFWDAINKVYDLWTAKSDFGGASLAALAVGLLTVAIKVALTSMTQRIGRQTNNSAILALACDHRNDIYAASAASAGIFLGRMGYTWVDPLAGALVALVILRTGIEILRKSSDDLMDTVPGKMLNHEVTHILSDIPGVRQVEEILAHRFGEYLVINVTIGIDGSLTVTEGDQIASLVEHELHQKISLLKRVHVHYHPVYRPHDQRQE
ncbi:MAG: cation diffusion facilitator family transporter [Victivallales bacterium]|jgi:cation diffusion facilitator family transporter